MTRDSRGRFLAIVNGKCYGKYATQMAAEYKISSVAWSLKMNKVGLRRKIKTK